MRFPSGSLDRALIGLAAVAYLATFWLVAGFTCDDAGISFCYARNLAEGHGLVLTPGSERAEGYSNLLWVVLLAAGFRAGLEPVLVAKGLALAAGLASLLLLWRLPSLAAGRPAATTDALGPLLLSVSAPHVFWTAGGLASTFFAFLLLAAATAFAIEYRRERALPASAALLFLAALTRPEVPLYAAMALIAVAVAYGRNWRRTAAWAATFGLPLLAFHCWRFCYFGSWLSPVALVKMPVPALSRFVPGSLGWDYLTGGLAQALPLALAPLVICGLASLLTTLPGLWIAGSLAATGLFILASGGDWMQHGRFLTPGLPFLYLGVGAGAAVLLRWFRELRLLSPAAEPRAALALVALVAVSAGIPQVAILAEAEHKARVTFSSRVERGVLFGRMARQAGLERAVLADTDAGGTSWASGLELLDLTGLTDRILCRHRNDPVLRDEYIFGQRKPAFIRLSGVWVEATGLTRSPRLAREYLPLPALPGDHAGDANFVRKELLVAAAGEQPEVRVGRALGGELLLEGLTLQSPLSAPGGRAELLLYWRTLAPKAEAHRVRVRLGDASTGAEEEHALALGWYPARSWKQGELIRERVNLTLSATQPEGSCAIRIAMGPAGQSWSECETGASVRISRADCLRQAGELRASLAVWAGATMPREALTRRLRAAELSGVLAPEQFLELQRLAAVELRSRASERAALGRERAPDWPGEAVACLLQARVWGLPGLQQGRELASSLARRAAESVALGDLFGASRLLGLAVRAAPHEARLLSERDRLWQRLARRCDEAPEASPAVPPSHGVCWSAAGTASSGGLQAETGDSL